MGTPSETDTASEVVQDGAGRAAYVVTADGAVSAAGVVARRGACGGSGWDYLPMRNSRKSASSSWIPAMAAP
jgi:hypothetical protein